MNGISKKLPLFLLAILLLAGSMSCAEKPAAPGISPEITSVLPNDPFTRANRADMPVEQIDVRLWLEANPVLNEIVPLVVSVKANEIVGRIKFQLILPAEISLDSGSLQWEEDLAAGGSSRKSIQVKIEAGGNYLVQVHAVGQTASGASVSVKRTLYIYEGSIKPVEKTPGASATPGVNMPFTANIAISPEPVPGQIVRIQSWLRSEYCLTNVSFKFTLSEGLQLLGGTQEATQDLIYETDFIHFDTLVQVLKPGVWPVTFSAVSRGKKDNILRMDDLILDLNAAGPTDSWIDINPQ